MPTTPTYSLPYPAITDPPNGAKQIQALADATDTILGAVDGRVDDLRTHVEAPLDGGEWRSTSTEPLAVGTNDLLDVWDTVVDTPTGISLSHGTFHVDRGGVWEISASIRVTTADGVYLWICPYGNADHAWRKNSSGTSSNLAISLVKRLTSGDSFGIAYWLYSAGSLNPNEGGGADGTVPGVSAYRIGA